MSLYIINVCTVWQFRGWIKLNQMDGSINCMQLASSPDKTVSVLVLGRSDGNEAPKWKDVANLRDGRERMGYNPAEKVQDISCEDLEDVQSIEGAVSEDVTRKLGLLRKGGDRAALARL